MPGSAFIPRPDEKIWVCRFCGRVTEADEDGILAEHKASSLLVETKICKGSGWQGWEYRA